ncbi:MFS transporter [Marispirochaeta aestuarii]|uniref:MFS transporter n=1 Tax=Marispirochaeta aestuarii TaxID=1963862 RepID=UPI0029C70E61|nr:MFS transporter [Marispirochaeta aestuarii]
MKNSSMPAGQDSRKGIISWSLYDWGNSAFATTVMGGFFPLFFKAYWSDPANPQASTFYLGSSVSIASIIVALSAPILGAIADKGSLKKRMLFAFAYLGILSTGALWFVRQGNWKLAAVLYILGTVGFSGGNIFYDALLVSVASRKKVDYVSSLGFALGYIGGGLLFLVNVIMFQRPELFGIPDGNTAIRLAFLSVALWWALFSLPLFLFVPEPRTGKREGFSSAVVRGWRQIRETINHIRHLKVVGLFLLAYWFYIDGVDTIIRMSVDYGSSLGFSGGALITALLMVQFIAFPGALLYNLFARKVGIKRAIITAIFAYCMIAVLGYFMKTEAHFFMLAALVGLFQGGIQALSRSFYSRIIPEKRAGEFYGFFNMLGKFAAVLGPFMMGSVTILTGSNRLGILSIILLFLAGGILFARVDQQEGERMAEEYLE